jgi:hypothetical protein
MAKLFLYVALVDFGRGGKTGAQRVTREFESAFDLGEFVAAFDRQPEAIVSSSSERRSTADFFTGGISAPDRAKQALHRRVAKARDQSLFADLRRQINLPSITSTYRWLARRKKSAAMTEVMIDIASG